MHWVNCRTPSIRPFRSTVSGQPPRTLRLAVYPLRPWCGRYRTASHRSDQGSLGRERILRRCHDEGSGEAASSQSGTALSRYTEPRLVKLLRLRLTLVLYFARPPPLLSASAESLSTSPTSKSPSLLPAARANVDQVQVRKARELASCWPCYSSIATADANVLVLRALLIAQGALALYRISKANEVQRMNGIGRRIQTEGKSAHHNSSLIISSGLARSLARSS